jgi:hypothetical protein
MKKIVAAIAIVIFAQTVFAQQKQSYSPAEKVIIACESVQLTNSLIEKKMVDIQNNQLTDYGIYAFKNILEISVKDFNESLLRVLLINKSDRFIASALKVIYIDKNYCKEYLDRAKDILSNPELSALDDKERDKVADLRKQGKPVPAEARLTVHQMPAEAESLFRKRLNEAIKNESIREKIPETPKELLE